MSTFATDGPADERDARIEELEGRLVALERALVLAAIPLEVLNADNYMGAHWMAPGVAKSVTAAVAAIRRAAR